MIDLEMALPEIMTVEEVAQRLRCSKAHVCNAINGKVSGVTTLPAISMGRRKLIRVSALAAWLAQNEPGGGNAMKEASSFASREGYGYGSGCGAKANTAGPKHSGKDHR
jgi:excisionase family DNA binding protein